MVGSYLLVLINFAKFATIAIYLSSAIIVYHCLSNISLLSYHKVLFSASHYGAWVEFCSWQRTEQCREAKESASTLTEEKINYFKQYYSKGEHRKALVRHIHNELKKKAIAEEIKKWIEPYENMVK